MKLFLFQVILPGSGMKRKKSDEMIRKALEKQNNTINVLNTEIRDMSNNMSQIQEHIETEVRRRMKEKKEGEGERKEERNKRKRKVRFEEEQPQTKTTKKYLISQTSPQAD